MSVKNTAHSRIAIVVFALASAVLTVPVFGAAVSKISNDAFAPLRNRTMMRKIIVDKLPIYDGKRSVIELEEFHVWAPGAKVIVHGDNNEVIAQLDPTPMRFFRGSVNGDPESFAYFSTDVDGGNVQGLVVTKDKKLSIASQRRPSKSGEMLQPLDTFMTEFRDADAVADGEKVWQCDVDKQMRIIPASATKVRATGANGLPIVAHGITGTQSYAIKIDILTDFELYQSAGSNLTALQNYVVNLTGAVSTIYNRDLHTNVTQGNILTYTIVGDPWTATNPTAGLIEVGDYVHANGTTASNTVFLSGKNILGGVAWEAIEGGSEFPCSGGSCGDPAFNGHYAGPHAWCGGIAVGTVPNPDATTGTTLYGMPNTNYWPLAEYAHELGHNMSGHHTHCVAIQPGELAAAGFFELPTPSTQLFVDHCYGSEGAGCNASANYVAGSQGVLKGTIMSYCHNVFLASTPQSRYVFGLPAEPSHHELDDYMLKAAGPLDGGSNIVTAVGAFTISAITASSTVGASSTGNTASITASPSGGATFAWTITNGTITSAANIASIMYTAGAAGTVVLRATAYGTNRTGVTDTKVVTIGAGLPAPTNVVAAATTTTNVNLSWTMAAGAVTYNVYRSGPTNFGTFTLRGSPAGLTFSDTVSSTAGAYLYKVRAVNGVESADSNVDLATNVIFTDATLNVQSTTVKGAHITQLRTAVDAVRALAGIGAGSYTDTTVNTALRVRRLHIMDLHTALNGARTTLGLSAVSVPAITVNITTIKKVDITDLRGGVQ